MTPGRSCPVPLRLLLTAGSLFLGVGEVEIVITVADEFTTIPEPGVFILAAMGLLAAFLGPLDVRGLPKPE